MKIGQSIGSVKRIERFALASRRKAMMVKGPGGNQHIRPVVSRCFVIC